MRALTLLRVSGIPVRLDASWLILALVITWSLTLQFAGVYPGWTAVAYWSMAVATAAIIFVCLILHELGHALVGQRFGMRIRSITLFVFGGVADLEDEPRSARAEFWMAVAGPAVSLALAGGFVLLAVLARVSEWPLPVLAVLHELALINTVLAVFNMVPAFPLDGGRVLRALIWAATSNLRRATAISSQLGQGIGTAMIVLGVFTVLGGHFLAGLWWMILGWFLKNIAERSYSEVRIRARLEGKPVRQFMTREVTSVQPDLEVADLVEHYVYQQHHKLYPVRTNGHLLGYVTPNEIKKLAREDWPRRHVGDIMTADLDPVLITPDASALDALSRMQQSGQSRLLVVDDGKLVGILTLRDLLEFLNLKIELEEG